MVFTEETDFWAERAERRLLMGVSESICLARFVEGCFSSGLGSSEGALCLGMVGMGGRGFWFGDYVGCFGCRERWEWE